MLKFGLLGRNISYSKSPKLHQHIFDMLGIYGEYVLFDTEKEDDQETFKIKKVIDKIKTGEINGLNVTIPHKENVINFLDELDGIAKDIGAVNTIVLKNGKLKGYNTDYFGILETFKNLKIISSVGDKNYFISKNPVYIFGTGGSSKAVQKVVKDLYGEFILVSREKKSDVITYDELENLQSGFLLVNTSPVKINENIGKKFENIFELKYNIDINSDFSYCKNFIGGLLMLVVQGIKSEEIWLKKKIDVNIISKIFEAMKK
ncbi:MAG: shikimate dehydrogenase family protein [Fusobacteriaceae bacterium]